MIKPLPNLSLIVAMDANQLIGRDNHLPWFIPEDLAYFRAQTLGKNVIMGKNTWLSLGKALDQRTNIVLTRDPEFYLSGLVTCNSIEDVLSFIGREDSFVIGGAGVFMQFMPYVSQLHITKINGSFEGDTFFPEVDFRAWELVYYETKKTQSGIEISFNQFQRKQYR